MKSLGLLLFTLYQAAAFPSIAGLQPRRAPGTGCSTSSACDAWLPISDEKIQYDPNNPTATQKLSKGRNNGGALTPITFFDGEAQLVSVHGENAYQEPGPEDIRGPCPGLNAAANHGYLPRSGIASITETIAGLGALYGMSVDLAGFLAAYAVAIDGDLLSTTWSIGGPGDGSRLLGSGDGISYSHNKYEGDSSIGRCDAYINNGDAYSLSIPRFKYVWETGMADDTWTLDDISRAFTKNTFRSEMQNPLYFAPLFSTTLVSPAAYNFVVVFMSNHTAEDPAGALHGEVFKQFFSVEGDYPNFKWNPGQERVPENWYRRPLAEPYTAHTGVFGDLIFEFLAYPDSFRFGGNTNGVNTYAGVDLENLTGGVYNYDSIFKGDNLACMFYQTIQQGIPDALTTGLSGDALNLLMPYAEKAFGGLSACPQVSKFNDNNLPVYPGHTYSPTAENNNCD